MSKKVLVVIADGTEEIEACGIVDTLRRAEADVLVASVSGEQITASRGVKIVCDKLISECVGEDFDMIVLPGGMPGAVNLRNCSVLIEMLKKQKQAGKFIASICASPAVVLAEHHLIDDRKATCYPAMLDKLPNPENKEVVVDKNVITSQGPGTALEFSVKLVEVLFGKEKASQIADAMLLR